MDKQDLAVIVICAGAVVGGVGLILGLVYGIITVARWAWNG